MIVLTSPAKTLDTDAGKNQGEYSIPKFSKEALQLVRILKKMNKTELMSLLKISENLADTNYHRYQSFEKEYNLKNANPSIYAFKGDVFQGLAIESLDHQDIAYANNHIRILSGLYGLLKPLDLMQPYRLEMGTSLENSRGQNLYSFWGDRITKALNQEIKETKQQIILNLASYEYFKVIDKKKLIGTLVTANFKENRNGLYRFISFNAKKARGMMMRYIIKNKIEEIEHLKGFDHDGYVYNGELSKENELIFTR